MNDEQLKIGEIYYENICKSLPRQIESVPFIYAITKLLICASENQPEPEKAFDEFVEILQRRYKNVLEYKGSRDA